MEAKLAKHFQPVFRNLEWGMSSAVNVKIDKGKSLMETFHYHPQVELISIRNCKGSIIVGTKVWSLKQDEILLIGKNTPHGFFYNHHVDTNEQQTPHALVVQFEEYFMGRDFFSIPESHNIRRLLTTARNGLLVKEGKRDYVASLMERMLDAQGFKKLLILLEILSAVQENEGNYEVLRETDQATNKAVEDDARLNEVWDYTAKHYTQPIRIEDVAFRINLTKESFCRFFKTKTEMTYMEYLFSYRIDKAKAMILENRLSVKEIGYACGFLSLSNFYCQFKKILRCSPLEYQNELFTRLRD